MLGDCLDERESPYVEWISNNIIEEDGHPVGIDVDSVMEEIRMTSSSEDRHRQLHLDDPASDVEYSRESNSSSHGRDEDDDGDNGN